MTAKRFMIDDAGTLIDMHTRDTFDYVSDVCDLLNKQHETIQRLQQNIDELLSVNVEKELLEENEQLKEENKFAKLLANHRGEMVAFADSLIQDVNDELTQKMWYQFKEELYQKWKKKKRDKMTERFKRYLFDGGFSFDEEYIPPRWSIVDRKNNKSPFGFLEFDDEHKDLCDKIVDSLNEFVDEYNHLKEENEQCKMMIATLRNIVLENGIDVE